MELVLDDIAVGKVKKPGKYDYGDSNKIMSFSANNKPKFVEFDPLETFLKKFKNICAHNIQNGEAYHQNYLYYLQKCWGEHLGIVITPEIIWYTLLCEIAALVKENPEQYRQLFTNSTDKKEILVEGGDIILPLGKIVAELRKLVPTDIATFLPQTSTLTPHSLFAQYAAFCDICSPYYDYSMFMCGIPKIDIRGTKEDYQLITYHWDNVSELIGKSEWTEKVKLTLNRIVEELENPEFWKDIFALERCGSGGQVEVIGWFSDLYRIEPSIRFVGNYTTGISIVNYKNISTNKNYSLNSGLFYSKMEGDFLVPEFGFVVEEKHDVSA